MLPVLPTPGFPSRHRPNLFSFPLILAVLLLRLTAGLTAAAPLIEISISPEGRVKASAGEAKPVLVQGAWTEFEIVIDNTAGLTSPLAIESLQLLTSAGDVSRARWLKLEIVPPGPLSGKPEETRILRLWSRDAGRRAAVFNINAGQGSQDLGFRSDVLLTFVVKRAATATTPASLSPGRDSPDGWGRARCRDASGPHGLKPFAALAARYTISDFANKTRRPFNAQRRPALCSSSICALCSREK